MDNNIVWKPLRPEKTNMYAFMRYVEQRYELHLPDYQALHTWSINYPMDFWPSVADFFNIKFNTPPSEICNDYKDMLDAQWFSGATFNFAEKLLSRNDEHIALVSINEAGERKSLSYSQLRIQVAACAAGLQALGIGVGDRVAALMPNIANTIIAMLATSALGATWSSCSPDFGAEAAIDRLGQIEPKILFTCDGHQYQGKSHSAAEKILQIQAAIPSLITIVVSPIIDEDNSLLDNFTSWEAFLSHNKILEFQPFAFNHPLYILFSSGTTGKPKCIIHSTGGTLLQHLKELGLHTDIKSQDNHFFYTTCGWMMWNWMVSTLALGATLTLYEGCPTFPDANRLFQLILQENITVFGTSAKFISAVEKADVHPITYLAESPLRCILSTGSPLLPTNFNFVYQFIKADVQLSSISGGTDIVSCFALGNPLLPVYQGELQCFGLGMAVEVFNEQGQSVEQQRGEMVCTKPFPAMPIGFWNDPLKALYKKAYFSYFPGVWTHGDFAEITPHHGLIIYGRSDTILNPGGVRIGTAEIYRQVEKISEVVDSVVIGQEWQDDVRVVLFVKLHVGETLDDALISRIKKTIKENASPRHVPAVILQVLDVPRTISGKIVEIAVRLTVQNQPINNLGSLANPEALAYFKNRKELMA